MRALTDGWTDGNTERRVHGTDFITSTADAGGKYAAFTDYILRVVFIPKDLKRSIFCGTYLKYALKINSLKKKLGACEHVSVIVRTIN